MSPRSKRSKQQLEHWLWRQVDSEACYGVRWHNIAQRSFTIPWVNQKSPEWKEEFSQLFKEYARHRGNLQSEKKIDYPKCKQNFKSALAKKSQAIGCLFKGKDKKYRIYKFTADYSSSIGGHDQQTRKQSSNGGVALDGICNNSGEFGDVVASHACAEQPCLVQADKEGESPETDFLQDSSEHFPGDADTLMLSGGIHDMLQEDSNLGESTHQVHENSVIKVLQLLNLSATGSSQIQSTAVDSTTENQSSFLEFATLEGNREINMQLTNSKINMAGCTTTVQMNRESAQLLLSPCGNPWDETACSNSGFTNSTMGVEKNQFVVPLNASSQQSLPSSSSSMETCEQENTHNQSETTLPTTISSCTAPVTAGPQSLSLSAPNVNTQGLMFIQVIYTSPQRVVKKQLITSDKCKIFFGKVDNKRLQAIIEKRDKGAVLMELPTVENSDFNDESKRRIKQTLQNMELGVVISYRDNDIHVVRRCQSHVYLSDGVSTSDRIPRSHVKEPDLEKKAFDFTTFEKSVKSYEPKQGCVDRDYFVLTLGCEILKNDPTPTRVVPVRIDVMHMKARAMRYETLGQAALMPDPQHSISDSFDNALHLSNIL